MLVAVINNYFQIIFKPDTAIFILPRSKNPYTSTPIPLSDKAIY
jgi:hypothetical protein